MPRENSNNNQMTNYALIRSNPLSRGRWGDAEVLSKHVSGEDELAR